MEAGALGTAGSPKTNGDALLLDWQGNPIPVLYAAGYAMAAVLGEAYGGAGGTLGPGMTFGYIAGRHLGRHLPNRIGGPAFVVAWMGRRVEIQPLC